MSRLKSSNPFEDEEEDDEFVKVYNNDNKASKNNYRPTALNYGAGINSPSSEYSSPFDDRRQNIQRQIDTSENTQLESTQRALASIYESEAMGVATAEELIRQGETLDRIEDKTTGITNTLKTSQRHLNSIKSVFGGIKNWWKGDKNTQSQDQNSSTAARAKLQQTVEKSDYSKKPAPEFGGFYEDDERDLDSRFMANAPVRSPSSGSYSTISPVTRSAREAEVDENLSMMSDGMSRLKSLAMDLGSEIEQQTEQLDRINVKVDGADHLVQNQNTQMRKILKK